MLSDALESSVTILQGPKGASYVVTSEDPQNVAQRLSRSYLVQRIDNVVRIVRKLR